MSDAAPADPRPLWIPETALPAVETMFETFVRRLGPGAQDRLDDFLAPLVESFDMQAERLEHRHRSLRDEIDSMPEAPAGTTDERRQTLLGQAETLSKRHAAFVVLRDAAAEQYKKHVGRSWDEDADLGDEIPYIPRPAD